jgi:hypothetical protein
MIVANFMLLICGIVFMVMLTHLIVTKLWPIKDEEDKK